MPINKTKILYGAIAATTLGLLTFFWPKPGPEAVLLDVSQRVLSGDWNRLSEDYADDVNELGGPAIARQLAEVLLTGYIDRIPPTLEPIFEPPPQTPPKGAPSGLVNLVQEHYERTRAFWLHFRRIDRVSEAVSIPVSVFQARDGKWQIRPSTILSGLLKKYSKDPAEKARRLSKAMEAAGIERIEFGNDTPRNRQELADGIW